jgi:outer membrane murein-binding lipoprotein Lpp
MTADTLTAADVPVTRAMLGSVRTEVLQRIDEVKADVQRLDAKIDAVKAEMNAGINGMQAQINGMQPQMNGMHAQTQAKLARIEFLVEEQNARNKVVLDGITARRSS